MLRDITLGQYYPADSILHRLDPRVKFVDRSFMSFPSFCSTTGATCLEPYSLR